MRLTVHTDYAFRVLMLLASDDRLWTIEEVASFYGISRNHLMKVAQNLAAAGFVASVRGRNGGLQLARDPKKITVGEVVRKLEGVGNFVECFDTHTNRCAVTPFCGLKGILSGGIAAFYQHLEGYTIDTLLPAGFQADVRSSSVGINSSQ